MKEYKMFIGGKWVDAVSKETFKDFNPYTGDVYATVPRAGLEDADRVLGAAFEARKVWQNVTPVQRALILMKAAQIMNENMEEYIEVLTNEGGSSYGKAIFEVSQTVDLLNTAAGDCKHIMGEVFHTDPSKLSFSMRKPRGTIVAISPWNFPLILSMYKVAYGLATGNTIILKPSSDTPVIGLKIGELFEKAGVPAGAVNVITGPGALLGDTLIDDKRSSFVAITGETGTGKHIAMRCAQNFKEYTLELGGKNPLVVLADADLDYTAKIAAWGAFLHQGEICMSVDRVIVEKPIANEVANRLAKIAEHLPCGDPNDKSVFIGPVISDKQVKSIDALVQDAVAKGAQLMCGGTYEGRVYKPTVLNCVTPEMRIYHEETFGPVACVICADDMEQALEIANDTMYGLSAGVITNNLEKALYLAEHIEAGMVHVNDSSVDAEASVPFGGVKQSGQGREGGQYSLNELTEVKWVTILKKQRELPF